jgi:adenylosuccinate synthase
MRFLEAGRASIIIDGQFGSTGKGLISGYLARQDPPDIAVANASANAGHTCIFDNLKIVAHHLPISGIISLDSTVYLGPASIIDPIILLQELHYLDNVKRLAIHPKAAVITQHDRETELDSSSQTTKIASTRHGVGAALARKVMRSAMLAGDHPDLAQYTREIDLHQAMNRGLKVMIEVPQGLDLGLNSGYTYPYVTSREIGIAQALADSQVHPSYLGRVMMTCRTYPIRVGNIYGNDREMGWSGPFYPDSKEISWEDLGVEPERTTVTKRVRRVATFSYQQYERSLDLIRPDFIFLNFVNYLKIPLSDFIKPMSKKPTHYGTGPNVKDVGPI